MTTRPDAVVRLRVQPRASRDEIVAWQDDALRVRVTAPPVEGEANAAVRSLLARTLRVAPSTVEVVRGDRSRDKLVRVVGLSLADVRARLAAVVTCLVLVVGAPLNLDVDIDGPWPSIGFPWPSIVSPAMAEHLTLEPGARALAPRPLDADVNVRVDPDGFHIGGRFFGLGQALGAWLRGRVRDRGVTLDGQLQGDRTFNFRLDADTERGMPRLRIEAYPGTL
jgi:uncharacterized protein (TIGR00251 family)